jgi:hypothetical protein
MSQLIKIRKLIWLKEFFEYQNKIIEKLFRIFFFFWFILIFIIFFKYVKGLSFEECPNYEFLKNLFDKIM